MGRHLRAEEAFVITELAHILNRRETDQGQIHDQRQQNKVMTEDRWGGFLHFGK